jgi:hypothetical protein
VVTVTSGSSPGVVFDSAGFENQAPPSALSAPAAGSYTLALAGTGANSTATVVTGSAGAGSVPQSAYSGDNYVALTRNVGTVFLQSKFTRSIELGTESFTLAYAFWGTQNAMAFGLGNDITNVTVGSAGVLAGWRYNTSAGDFTQYLNASQDDGPPTGIVDETVALDYHVNDWNTLVYTWDATSQSGTITLNGGTAAAAPRVGGVSGSQDPPTSVNRFLASPGATSTTVWMDAIPEPSSLSLLAIGAAALLGRRRSARSV